MTMLTALRHSVRPLAARSALATIFLLSLVGCGSGSGGAAPTNSAHASPAATAAVVPSATTPVAAATAGPMGAACALVTGAEASAAAGQAMALSGDAGTVCTFSAAADPSIVLAVQIFNDRAGMALDLSVEASSEHVAGLGDDAFWNPTLGTVFVRKGDRAFSVVMPSLANLTGSPDATRAKMVTLATASLARF